MKTPLTGSLKLISWGLVIAFMMITTGCKHYFKVTRVGDPLSDRISNYVIQGKIFILHNNEKAWILESPVVVDNQLKGRARNQYISNYTKRVKTSGANRYQKHGQQNLLKEVHIYATEATQLQDWQVSAALLAIQRIEVYEKDRAATTRSHIIGYFALIGVPIILAVSFALSGGMAVTF